jgi:hypothetical protein
MQAHQARVLGPQAEGCGGGLAAGAGRTHGEVRGGLAAGADFAISISDEKLSYKFLSHKFGQKFIQKLQYVGMIDICLTFVDKILGFSGLMMPKDEGKTVN